MNLCPHRLLDDIEKSVFMSQSIPRVQQWILASAGWPCCAGRELVLASWPLVAALWARGYNFSPQAGILGEARARGTPAPTELPHPGTSPAPARCRGRRGDCQWGPASQPRMDTPQLNRLILRVTTSWVLSFLLRTNMLSAYFLHSPNTSQPQHFRVKSSVLLFQQKSK